MNKNFKSGDEVYFKKDNLIREIEEINEKEGYVKFIKRAYEHSINDISYFNKDYGIGKCKDCEYLMETEVIQEKKIYINTDTITIDENIKVYNCLLTSNYIYDTIVSCNKFKKTHK
ncbi:MAG: hypothetical protein GY849_02135 [Deltaproteobacteria bacterium]|nr:hypothetical protein [Deltaproteobacteria bacterium]